MVNLFIYHNTFPFQCACYTDFIFYRWRPFAVRYMSDIHCRSVYYVIWLAAVTNHFIYEYFNWFLVVLLFLRFRKLLDFCHLRLDTCLVFENWFFVTFVTIMTLFSALIFKFTYTFPDYLEILASFIVSIVRYDCMAFWALQ